VPAASGSVDDLVTSGIIGVTSGWNPARIATLSDLSPKTGGARILRVKDKFELGLSIFMLIAGLSFLVTGVGGGRYRFNTGEWSFATPTAATRFIGATFLGTGIVIVCRRIRQR
jgi:hypothetical protein